LGSNNFYKVKRGLIFMGDENNLERDLKKLEDFARNHKTFVGNTRRGFINKLVYESNDEAYVKKLNKNILSNSFFYYELKTEIEQVYSCDEEKIKYRILVNFVENF